MTELEQIKVWNKIKEHLEKIYDKKTQNLYRRAFLVRFMNTYGFNPEKPVKTQKKALSVDLDDWEKEFVQDIQKAEQYQVDTRENKRQQTNVEFRNRMRDFVVKGGKFSDLPPELQNKTILEAYLDATILEMQECITFLENN